MMSLCKARLSGRNANPAGVSGTVGTLRNAGLALLLALPLAAFAAPAQPSAQAPAAVQPPAAPATPQTTGPAVAAPATGQPAPATPEGATAPAPAPAAQTPAQPPAPMPVQGPVGGPSAGNLMQTILGLCFVLALFAGLAWFMKRYGLKATGSSANLRVVGALNLGGRERILVVEVGDQWIVVGASPGRVNALATMPKQEGVAPGATLAGHMPPAAGFAGWLKQTIDKRNAK